MHDFENRILLTKNLNFFLPSVCPSFLLSFFLFSFLPPSFLPSFLSVSSRTTFSSVFSLLILNPSWVFHMENSYLISHTSKSSSRRYHLIITFVWSLTCAMFHLKQFTCSTKCKLHDKTYEIAIFTGLKLLESSSFLWLT